MVGAAFLALQVRFQRLLHLLQVSQLQRKLTAPACMRMCASRATAHDVCANLAAKADDNALACLVVTNNHAKAGELSKWISGWISILVIPEIDGHLTAEHASTDIAETGQFDAARVRAPLSDGH